MAQEIYNEGRVLGFSAWEIFVREALDSGMSPEDIPDEQEWLTAMIGSGASMVLNIAAGTSAGIHDYELPAGSKLAASGTIIASPFIGNCEWDTVSNFAKKVTSYGALINNTGSSYPSSGSVPPAPGASITYADADYRNCVSEFVKITDGIVYLKTATWVNSVTSVPPKKDIDPNYGSSKTVVRLYISSEIAYDTHIILTGFNNKCILRALAGFATGNGGGSADTTLDAGNVPKNGWFNGAMMGPGITPWATKIVFTLPSSAYSLLNSLNRTIPLGITSNTITKGDYQLTNLVNGSVKTNSVIDYNSIELTTYYDVHLNEFVGQVAPVIQENVTDVNLGANESYNTIVAWYPGMTASEIASASGNAKFFPPAIYGAKVTATGEQTLVPLDVAAPGTIKAFNDPTQAYNYTQILPNNYAVYHNPTTNMYSFVINNEPDPTKWIGAARLRYLTTPVVQLDVAATTTKLVSLTASDGSDLNTSGSSGEITAAGGGPRKLNWNDLKESLASNKSVNVLGTRLYAAATELSANNKLGVDTANNQIAEIGATKITVNPGSTGVSITTMTSGAVSPTPIAKFASGTSLRSGTNFIEFNNGLRLYIATSEPAATDVPVGSIGIGW